MFLLDLNLMLLKKPKDGYTISYGKSNGNPNEFLGQRKDLTPEKLLI